MTQETQETQKQNTMATANISVNIPVEEWNETRAQIRKICSGLDFLTAQQKNEYLTIEQVCKALNIGRCTFYNYKNSGKLKVSKIGKKMFVKQSDLDEAITNGVV